MLNISTIFSILAIISLAVFVISLIWLIIRQIYKLYKSKVDKVDYSWETTDTVLSIFSGLSIFLFIAFIIMIYKFRVKSNIIDEPENTLYGGYGLKKTLTPEQEKINPEQALSMSHLYNLFKYFFFEGKESYDLTEQYTFEEIGIISPYMKLRERFTGRKVFILNSYSINDDTSLASDSREISYIFRDINTEIMETDNWSICLPLGKLTSGAFTKIARLVTGSTVSGHATLVIIEKNNDVVSIYHLDPKEKDLYTDMINKFMNNLVIYFTRVSNGFDVVPDRQKLTCGVQPTTNNIHCVYYVFKMVYFYLDGGAKWNEKNLGKMICPGQKDIVNEISSLYQTVRNTGFSVFRRPVSHAHIGKYQFRDDGYLTTRDVKNIISQVEKEKERKVAAAEARATGAGATAAPAIPAVRDDEGEDWLMPEDEEL